MTRARIILALAILALSALVSAGSAQAAAPTLGPVSATDVQGVSALLIGSVNPSGLTTTYYFEYSTQSNFGGAVKTATHPAGSGSALRPARAAISGLSPKTSYYFRLVADNSSGPVTGTPATFKTTGGFGFLPGTEGFAVSSTATGGAPSNAAGSHPYQLSFTVGLNLGGQFEDQPAAQLPDGDLRNLHIEAPPGLIENPAVVSTCTLAQFHAPRESLFEKSRSGESCPDKSQVGTVDVKTSLGGGQTRRFGLFSLNPAPGVPAQLGFSPFGAPITIDEDLRPVGDGSYALALDASNIPQSLDMNGLEITLWGTPWGASHNIERGECLNEANPRFGWCKRSVGEPATDVPLAYLSLPHKCSGTLAFTASATSWQQGGEATATAVNRDSKGQPVEMGLCSGFGFEPKPVGQLTDTKASSPSGYNFQYTVDNTALTTPEFPAPSPARKAVVLLPEGVSINPSVGAGLGSCTPAQYAAETPLSKQGAGCPNSSKIGDFIVHTPLFSEFFSGSIYLAEPDDPATTAPGAENPFDTLIAVYLVAKIPNRGIQIKVAGKVVPDPATGRLTATFDGLPQLPYTDLNLTFRTGQRAFLVSPPSCGPATSTMELTPWAGSLSVHATSATQVNSGIEGSPCPSGPLPFSPTVRAGGVNSNVNSYTPYYVHLTRKDTEQEITSYSLVLPQGITGKLAGIPFCPDAAIEAARTKRGLAEKASPSCPAASAVGHISTGYGVGSSLTYTNGTIYLAGPYNGQPLSLVAINPATVGPFDLGNVVIRTAFSVDEHTAQLKIDAASSDRIPHILGGIPLHLRDIRIYMDRHEFTHNPSSCLASELTSTLTGAGSSFQSTADDSTSTSTDFFQLLNCRSLDFQPKLGVQLKGGTKRRAYPQLTVTFAARGQRDSNLKEIEVSMPHSEFFAQEHIRGICTKVQFNADNCPADTVYGSATAYTPLFDEPLKGPVYLRSSGGQIPDLVASLHSGAVHIVLEGAIGGTKSGGIQALFKELPDEPLEKFVMVLYGGKRGLMQNSSDICAEPPLATVKALGQANLGAEFTTKLRGQCKKTKKHKRSHTHGHRRRR